MRWRRGRADEPQPAPPPRPPVPATTTKPEARAEPAEDPCPPEETVVPVVTHTASTPAGPPREELEEFAHPDEEAEPLLMPGPLPAQPPLERAAPPVEPEPTVKAVRRPVKRASTAPTHAARPTAPLDEETSLNEPTRPQPAPPAIPRKKQPPVVPQKQQAPVATSKPAAPRPPAQKPWQESPRRRPGRLHAPSAETWRRIGDVALLLLAVGVLVMAFIALRA